MYEVVKVEKKRDRNALVAELDKAGAVFRGNAFRCCFHDDKHPSAAIFESDAGWRFKCHACGAQGDVWDVIAHNQGRTPGEVLRGVENNSGRPGDKPQIYDLDGLLAAIPGHGKKHYLYTDAAGTVKMVVVRAQTPDGKTFRQARPCGGGYIWGAPAKPWPLYNAPRIAAADAVVVVEGEKCADSLGYFGFCATTSPGGAKNAQAADWSPLSGKEVVLWPDNDEPGGRYMADVRRLLADLPRPPASIRTIDPARLMLADKQDCADYVRRLWDDGKTDDEIRASVRAAIDDAEPVTMTGGAGQLAGEIESIIAGKTATVPLRWRLTSALTNALKPGTVTMLCGNPGASKSFMLLEQFASWHDAGYQAAIFCLEESKTYHLRRINAQRAGLAGLTEDNWVSVNPELARAAVEQHEKFIDSIAKKIWVCPDTQPTLDALADWVEARCREGFRVVCIDPITGTRDTTPYSWREDSNFLHRVKQSATQCGSSIVLVTHPVKSVAFADLNSLARSAAYGRFAQTAVWLESHAEKESTILTDLGRTKILHNRTLHLLKCRNGRGQGLKLAFQFESETLRLRELGTIYKEPKRGSSDD